MDDYPYNELSWLRALRSGEEKIIKVKCLESNTVDLKHINDSS